MTSLVRQFTALTSAIFRHPQYTPDSHWLYDGATRIRMAPERSPKRVKTNPRPENETIKQAVAPAIELPGNTSHTVKDREGPIKTSDKQEDRLVRWPLIY
jgi:hypothetical protein